MYEREPPQECRIFMLLVAQRLQRCVNRWRVLRSLAAVTSGSVVG